MLFDTVPLCRHSLPYRSTQALAISIIETHYVRELTLNGDAALGFVLGESLRP